MTDFGKGPTLAQVNPWLRDEVEQIERILDVTERNSVIEGLPPYPRKLGSGCGKNSQPVLGPGKRLSNDVAHRDVISFERRNRPSQ
jgi:hypothetical protein